MTQDAIKGTIWSDWRFWKNNKERAFDRMALTSGLLKGNGSKGDGHVSDHLGFGSRAKHGVCNKTMLPSPVPKDYTTKEEYHNNAQVLEDSCTCSSWFVFDRSDKLGLQGFRHGQLQD